jgi:hypothetical protein
MRLATVSPAALFAAGIPLLLMIVTLPFAASPLPIG